MRPIVEILRGGRDGFGTEGLHLRFIRGCGRDLDAFGLVLERRLLRVGAQRDPCDGQQRCEEARECSHVVETIKTRDWPLLIPTRSRAPRSSARWSVARPCTTHLD